MHLHFIDYVGILGAFFILLGFYRINIGKWRNTSIWYELDNLVGAALMICYALSKQAYVSIVVNCVWVLVAFVGISSYAERHVLHHRQKKATKSKPAYIKTR